MDGKRGDGATPLIVHTELGNFEVAKVLIELNANVDLQDEVRRHVCEFMQKTGCVSACKLGQL